MRSRNYSNDRKKVRNWVLPVERMRWRGQCLKYCQMGTCVFIAKSHSFFLIHLALRCLSDMLILFEWCSLFITFWYRLVWAVYFTVMYIVGLMFHSLDSRQICNHSSPSPPVKEGFSDMFTLNSTSENPHKLEAVSEICLKYETGSSCPYWFGQPPPTPNEPDDVYEAKLLQ